MFKAFLEYFLHESALRMRKTLDERKLVERVLKGDEGAKSELYSAHQQKLYSFCVYFLGSNDPEIEDILQEVFMTAFQKLDRFEFRSSLDTWLTQICIHHCYRHFRMRSRQLAREENEMEILLKPHAMDQAALLDRETEKAEKIKRAERCLQSMGEPCRKILELRGKEGASYMEMAHILKVPVGTIMSRLARCTATLRGLVLRTMKGEKP